MNIPKSVVIHHSAVSRDKNADQFTAIDQYHKRKWGGKTKSDMGHYGGYHYHISSKGEVKQYRYDNETGAHTREKLMNYRSIGVCLTGNFDVEEPTTEQCASLYKLIKQLQRTYDIPDGNIVPHRKYATYKSCWGKLLPDDILGYLDVVLTKPKSVSPWAIKSVEKAINKGVAKDWKNPQEIVGNSTLQYVFKNMGVLDKVDPNGLTKERLIVALDRLGTMD